MRLGGVLEVGSFNDGVDRTRFLTESAVDALGHVDVVPGRPPAAVGPLLRLDGDGLRWTNGLAQLGGRDRSQLTSRPPVPVVSLAHNRLITTHSCKLYSTRGRDCGRSLRGHYLVNQWLLSI